MSSTSQQSIKSKGRKALSIVPIRLNSVMVIAVVVLLIVGSQAIGRVGGWLQESLFPTPQAHVITQGALIDQIQDLGQLVTKRVNMVNSNLRIDIAGGLLFSSRASHSISGFIASGVDLAQVGPDDVVRNNGRLVLTLKPVQLLFCDITAIEQYGHSLSVNPDFDGSRQLAEVVGLQEFIEEALEGGILPQGEIEAELRLTELLSHLTDEEIDIHFHDTEPLVPRECNPQLPDGWRQQADGTYVKR